MLGSSGLAARKTSGAGGVFRKRPFHEASGPFTDATTPKTALALCLDHGTDSDDEN
jgi:hypothetical protein